MSEFWRGVLFGGGAVIMLGFLCRAALHAAAERRFRATYMESLTPEDRERLVSFEGNGAATWRQFREREEMNARR